MGRVICKSGFGHAVDGASVSGCAMASFSVILRLMLNHPVAEVWRICQSAATKSNQAHKMVNFKKTFMVNVDVGRIDRAKVMVMEGSLQYIEPSLAGYYLMDLY